MFKIQRRGSRDGSVSASARRNPAVTLTANTINPSETNSTEFSLSGSKLEENWLKTNN